MKAPDLVWNVILRDEISYSGIKFRADFNYQCCYRRESSSVFCEFELVV